MCVRPCIIQLVQMPVAPTTMVIIANRSDPLPDRDREDIFMVIMGATQRLATSFTSYWLLILLLHKCLHR